MADVFEANVMTISPRKEVANLVRLWAKAYGDGPDEITLSQRGTRARIVICKGTFPPHAERVLRDQLKTLNRSFCVSVTRGNYGKFRTAHDGATWEAMQS